MRAFAYFLVVSQAETKLCPETGMDSLLHDYGLANMLRSFTHGRTMLGVLHILCYVQLFTCTGSDSLTTPTVSSTHGGPFITPPTNASTPEARTSPPPGLISLPTSLSRACTSCKGVDNGGALGAVAFCHDCPNLLCVQCRDAHHNMQHFAEHTRVVPLPVASNGEMALKIVSCFQVSVWRTLR
jgi:hypothetical protein